ncbi:MAG TPA: cytochrome c biogenesis protein CcdA [Candidatus Limnocylindria bacterium]|nr:cytochrome c biogenesis protein CcdA [Candidatus Limnocylindria bacterium]
MELSLALAFAAGVVSFITPCVLALVPVYLAVLAEAAVGGRSVLVPTALFSLGFSIVFILLGVSVGVIGMTLFREPVVRQIAGAIVIGLGLLMTGVFGPVLDRVPSPVGFAPASGGGGGAGPRSLGLGALVAVGWTPCIGPVLGAILAMGASTQDVAAATLLLVAYSAGLALPFLLVAAFLPRVRPALGWLRAHERPIRIASGLAVMAVGVLIVLDAFTALAGLFGEFFL